jgi:uncharacterized protein DUF4242
LSPGAGGPTVGAMANFLIELYLPRTDRAAFNCSVRRARLAADELSRQGTPVRYLHSVFVPEDETCFHLYEADSPDRVREAARCAALRFERVSEAVSAPGPDWKGD